MCLCSFMAAEYDDLPEPVKKEVQAFADVNVAWLSKVLSGAAAVKPEESERRARAIFAAVAGAQLMARSRSDISLYDAMIEGYRAAGLLVAEDVGIKAASMYHHFPTKADLVRGGRPALLGGLGGVPGGHVGRGAGPDPGLVPLSGDVPVGAREREYRMCLASFMAAENDDLPESVKKEVRAFADVNVAWLKTTLSKAGVVKPRESERRARAIYAAVAVRS